MVFGFVFVFSTFSPFKCLYHCYYIVREDYKWDDRLEDLELQFDVVLDNVLERIVVLFTIFLWVTLVRAVKHKSGIACSLYKS